MGNIERGAGGVEIFSGPCSVDIKNIHEIYQLADMQVRNIRGEMQQGIFGARMVGIKSRTRKDDTGKGMGIDFAVFEENMMIFTNGGNRNDFIVPPSVGMAKELIEKTRMHVATEIMRPMVQVPCFVNAQIETGKLLLWNPSVNQLGWGIEEMAILSKGKNWDIGLKHGKWLGSPLNEAQIPGANMTNMESTWTGLATFANGLDGWLILIHRGVDIPEKGPFRSLPIHEAALRAKISLRRETKKSLLYFDPSHSFGPDMRDKIVEGTIEALLMQQGTEWLYDGVLIEAGTSSTDTNQHITHDELQEILDYIATKREIRIPE